MGEIFLDRALGLLASEKQKDRTDGLAGWLVKNVLLEKASTKWTHQT